MANLLDKPRFAFSFSGSEYTELARMLLADRYLFPSDSPQRVRGGNESIQDLSNRLTDAIERGENVKSSHEALQSFRLDTRMIKVAIRSRLDSAQCREYISGLPFELMAAQSPHHNSWDGDRDYFPPSFSDMHLPQGWACAFRGKGHDRLVSRRWLKYAGPWLLIRNEERDVSFVQFHSLDADAETALEQAKPGHQRMGISHTGGFIQTSFVYRYDWDGIYLPEDQILEIVVHGREVEQREMLEACALRHYQPLGDDQPLDNVRYVS